MHYTIRLMAHLNHMGNLLRRQGDNSAAATYFRRCLAIQEELVPGSLLVAAGLNNLGLVVKDLGDLEEAEGYLQRSLEASRQLKIFEARCLAAQQVLEPDPGLPAELDSRRRLNTVRLRRTLTAIATLTAAPVATREQLRAELEALRADAAAIADEIAQAAPSADGGGG